MSSVILRNVVKKYNNVIAVKNIDLDILSQEFVVLVGPSGCGKTTTLRTIAGLEKISDGTIAIEDQIVNDLPPKERDIAMVFQNYALYPHVTVYENMAFALRLRKKSKEYIDKRIRDVAKILDMEEFLNRKPSELSGGQKQRVAIGRAIVREPKVFLMDEPLSNLDAKLRVQMRAEISRLHNKLKITTVYVTHDQVEAMTMATKIVVMKDGEIQQVDNPQHVYNHPINKFVASFIGSPPMNFIKGKIQTKNEKLYFVSVIGELKIESCHVEQLISSCESEVFYGIRPENLSICKGNQMEETSCLDGEVDVVEPLGSEQVIYVKLCDNSVIMVKEDPDLEVKPGDKVKVTSQIGKAHYFSAETEKSLLFIK